MSSTFLPPTVSDPQPYSKQKLKVFLSPCAGLENLYQTVNNWWEEALTNQLASCPSGPSSNFSCRVHDTGSLSKAEERAYASLLSITATPSGFRTPFTEALWTEFLACRKQADLLSAQNLLYFLQSCAEEYKSSLSQENASSIWALMHLLLASTAVATHPLVVDVLRSDCWSKVKGCSCQCEAGANYGPILSPVH